MAVRGWNFQHDEKVTGSYPVGSKVSCPGDTFIYGH